MVGLMGGTPDLTRRTARSKLSAANARFNDKRAKYQAVIPPTDVFYPSSSKWRVACMEQRAQARTQDTWTAQDAQEALQQPETTPTLG